MRSVLVSILLAASVSACATVSMVSTEAMVETGLTAEQSSLRKVSDAYVDLAERKQWVQKNTGLLGFARVLMDGVSGDDDADESDGYAATLKSNADPIDLLKADIESAAHGLDVATMEAEKLHGAEVTAKSLRADLVSYETALVTAKKARRTFVTTLADMDVNAAAPASDALNSFDTSIDSARNVADELADHAADRKNSEATS